MANTLQLAEQKYVGRVSNQYASVLTDNVCRVSFDVVAQYGESVSFDVKVSRLLGDGDKNTKLRKNGATEEWLSYGLSLAPAREAGLKTLCPHAKSCAVSCLDHSGFGSIHQSIHTGRIAKTIAWQLQPEWFEARLIHEVELRHAKALELGKRLCVRLNMFSDVVWEKRCPEIFQRFADVQFYDYTKNPRRAGQLLENYWVTFSRDESNEAKALEHIRNGRNASIVFNRTIPGEYRGIPVVSGEESDLRFADPRGVWIGLTFKGRDVDRYHALESGFCVDPNAAR